MANLKQIVKHLQKLQLPYKLVDLGEDVYTIEAKVRAIGVDPGTIVKTLIIRTNPSTHYIRSGPSGFAALALRGSDRVDFKKIRAKFGGKSELAKPQEVLEVVGVPVGAVCPILLNIPLFFDPKVMDLKNVHMGSGDLAHGLEMELDDLLEAVAGYKVEKVSG